MSITNYAEAKCLDALCGNATFTTPGTVYIKLHIGDPGEDCTANAAAHTTRVATDFAAASAGTIASNLTTTFTSMAANETISYFSAWDALTVGNPLFYGALTASKTVAIGDNLSFASGAITGTLD